MSAVVKYVGMPMLVAIASLLPTAQAARPKPEIVSASTLQVTQFYGVIDPTRMQVMKGSALGAAVQRECGITQFPVLEPIEEPVGAFMAPAAAFVGSIVVDWVAGQAMKYLSKQAAEQVKAHTAGYSNTPEYDDLFAKRKWSADGSQSCVVAQRWYCTQQVDALADCPKPKVELASTMIFVLRREGGALKALPLGYEFNRFVPRHSKGRLAFSAGLAVQAIGAKDGAGYYWTSERDGKEAVLIDDDCDADGKRLPTGNCMDVETPDWSKAAVLPMPPGLPEGAESSMAALEVTVAEVGRPDAWTKAWASFTAASEGDVSEAMSSALKKQWKLGTE